MWVSPLLNEPSLSLPQILTCLDPAGELSRKCLYALRKLCGSRRILPPDFELSKVLLPPDKPPKAQGGFCDAYEGSIGIKVCIKRLRISPMESQQGKMKEVRRSCEFPLNRHPHTLRSCFTRKPSCGNTWSIQTSCLSRESPSAHFNLSQSGCPMERYDTMPGLNLKQTSLHW